MSFFRNPNSASPINGITATLLSSTGVTRATLTGIVLSGFKPDQLRTATIRTLSDQIGANGVTIQISFTPKNTLRANDKGKVFVYFPRWNPDEGTFALHSLSTPVCSSVTGMSSMMSCSYSQDTQFLTITNPVSSDTSGTLLTFSVTNFRNPYNGKPKTGYYIWTTDDQNGEIDSS